MVVYLAVLLLFCTEQHVNKSTSIFLYSHMRFLLNFVLIFWLKLLLKHTHKKKQKFLHCHDYTKCVLI